MAFNNPSSKLARAIRALLILQGKAESTDCYIYLNSSARTLPNRTILVPTFTPERPHRPEGICSVQIIHRHDGVLQSNEASDLEKRRVEMDAYLGDTLDSLMFGDGNSLNAVADAITQAGRWLAQTDNTPEGDKIAKDNADMVNFRCDWVKLGSPMISQGEADDNATHWIQALHFTAFVSTATVVN